MPYPIHSIQSPLMAVAFPFLSLIPLIPHPYSSSLQDSSTFGEPWLRPAVILLAVVSWIRLISPFSLLGFIFLWSVPWVLVRPFVRPIP